jgi:hypothetical protein
MIRIVRGVAKITENLSESKSLTLHTILRFWIYLTESVYSQKIALDKKGSLFYLINNVLM